MPWDSRTEAAIAAFDVGRYLRARRIEHRMTNTQQAILSCPHCGRPKLYVSMRNKLFICHHCGDGFKGSLPRLVAALEQCVLRDALEVVVAFARDAPAPVVRHERPVVLADLALPEHYERLSREDDPRQRRYWRYLDQRGVDTHLALRHRMGYCRFGRYNHRLIVPAIVQGEITTWIARDVTGTAEQKVLTPTDYPQGNTLFNLDAVRGTGEAVLVEGVFDALRLPTRCVATFGKKFSMKQWKLLRDAGVRRLTIAWDSDAWLDAVRTACRMAQAFDDVRVAQITGKDPAEMDVRDLEDCLAAARYVGEMDLFRAESVQWEQKQWPKRNLSSTTT